jgi:hypothetical protein
MSVWESGAAAWPGGQETEYYKGNPGPLIAQIIGPDFGLAPEQCGLYFLSASGGIVGQSYLESQPADLSGQRLCFAAGCRNISSPGPLTWIDTPDEFDFRRYSGIQCGT